MHPLPLFLPLVLVQDPFAGGRNFQLDLGHTLESKSATRTVVADITNDFLPDVAVLFEGMVAVGYGLDAYLAVAPLPDTVTGLDVHDFTVVELAGEERLTLVGPGGLRTLTRQPGQWVASADHAAGGWAGALNVRTLDLDGNASPDLVGVSASGDSLLILKDYDGTTGTALAAIPVGGQITHLAVLDWVAGGADEIAIAMDDGLVQVLDATGATLASATATDPVRAVFGVRCRDEGQVRLAFVEGRESTGDTLHLISPAAAPEALFLGPFLARSGAAADLDDDGDEDLVLSGASTSEHWMVPNRSGEGGAVIASSVPVVVATGPSTPSPAQTGEPGLGDFDHDGDIDLVTVIEDGNVLDVRFNPLVDAKETEPVLGTRGPDVKITPAAGHFPHTMTLWFEPGSSPPANYDGVHVRVWRKPDFEQPLTPTVWIDQVFDAAPHTAGTTVEFLIYEPDPFEMESMYLIHVRYVTRDANDEVVEAGGTSRWLYFQDENYVPRYDRGDYPGIVTFGGQISGGGAPGDNPPPGACDD